MRKTMVYLEERQRAVLARYARRRGLPMAAVIREVVDRLLAGVERPPKSHRVGVAAGGEREPISEQVEEALAVHLRGRRGDDPRRYRRPLRARRP